MRPLAETPLVLGHFAVDHAPFARRCAAAAAGGFSGISVEFNEIQRLYAETGEAAVRETLNRNGLRVDHIELVRLPGPGGAERAATHAAYVDLACRLGARGVHAVALDRDASLAAVAEAYGALADRAAERGILCGLEFVPALSAVSTAVAAREVVERVDRSNALLVIDSFHFFRGGDPWSAIETLPKGSVLTVQINDGAIPAPTDDYGWEARSGRLPPGEGDFDLVRFLAAMDAVRLPAGVTLEVMSDALDLRPVEEVARATARAARAIGP